MKNVNRFIKAFAILLWFVTLELAAQVPISPMFSAMNYWMPHFPAYGHQNGQVDLYWPQIKAAGITHMRVGGKAYDQGNMFLPGDLKDIVNTMRSHGIEPIVQVPINTASTVAQNATAASSLVSAMNTGTLIAKPITFWEIGNEPDGAYSNSYNTPTVIASYIKACAAAMKSVTGQEFIKTIGPCYASYNQIDYGKFLDPADAAHFIGGTTVVNGQTVPYLDYIAFNQYPYDYDKYVGTSTTAVTRDDVISYLRSSGRMFDDLGHLKLKLTAQWVTDHRFLLVL